MGYDPDFYNAYKAYLNESTVRKAHGFVFKLALTNPDFQNVLDFGCGMFNEFFVHANPQRYIGIDVNVPTESGEKRLIQADYRNMPLTDLTCHSPTAFVSLFSTEITAPADENYTFYEKIFRELPTVNSGLVGGFYYVSKKHQNPIKETGGVVSYQTLDNIEDVRSDVFDEKRLTLAVPNQMFGQDVYEVWKFLERKE